MVVLGRAHPGGTGIAGCFLGKEAESPVQGFTEASVFMPFSYSLFSFLCGTELAVLHATSKARFL